MQDIKHREQKMQESIKKYNYRNFLKQICSRYSLNFYKKDGIISKYPETDRSKRVLSPKDYNTQRGSTINFGRDYSSGISFLKQYQELFLSVPLPSLIQNNPENASFSETSGRGLKNAYLSFAVFLDVENILYSFHVKENCNNILNSVMVWTENNNIYQSTGIIKSHNIFYSKLINTSSNLWFCNNMIGCQECIGCSNQQNKAYMIQNQQYTKEEYFSQKTKILKQKENFTNHRKQVIEVNNNLSSENCTGALTIQSQDINNGYMTYNTHHGKNTLLFGSKNGNKHNFNCFLSGAPSQDHGYNTCNTGGGDHVYCCDFVAFSSNVYYSSNLDHCSYCLGCAGLQNKSFCILNKQYSKEERFAKANEIFAQMDANGSLGKFFPGSMNPFYFNDTAAYLIDDSFTKEEVTAEGYLRRDEEIKVDIPEGSQVVKTTELNNYQGFDTDGKRSINPDILKKVIVDEKGDAYRIVKMEYDFLMKHGLPLPTLHRLDRIKLGFRF